MEMDKFIVATDFVIMNRKKILLTKRNTEPFKGKFTIPGGIMETNETIEETCVREAKEELGLDVEPVEILGAYSDLERDSRGRSISVAFICKPKNLEVKLNEEATEARWFELNEINTSDLGFDHGKIIEDLKKWKKSGGTYWSSK